MLHRGVGADKRDQLRVGPLVMLSAINTIIIGYG